MKTIQQIISKGATMKSLQQIEDEMEKSNPKFFKAYAATTLDRSILRMTLANAYLVGYREAIEDERKFR